MSRIPQPLTPKFTPTKSRTMSGFQPNLGEAVQAVYVTRRWRCHRIQIPNDFGWIGGF